MLEWITATLGITAVKWTMGGIAALVIGWFLKRVPVQTIRAKVGAVMYGFGTGISVAMGKHHVKPLRYVYQKVLEPFIIRFVKDVVMWGIMKFLDGLESDNKELKDTNPEAIEN